MTNEEALRRIKDAGEAMRRFASDYVTATTRNGLMIDPHVFVARSLGPRTVVSPMFLKIQQHGMPHVSDLVAELQRQFATRSLPIVIAFISFGAARRVDVKDDAMRSLAMLTVCDVTGGKTQYFRDWVADGPVGNWYENKDSNLVGEILLDSLSLAAKQSKYLSDSAVVKDKVDAMQYGADTCELPDSFGGAQP
jgi:hypothetical protein